MSMKEEEQEAGIPEWVVTFGDMMSLLLTFFVLLFAMSEVKEEKSQAMIESLRRQFGHQAHMYEPLPGSSVPMNAKMSRIVSLGRARRFDTLNGGDKVKAPIGDYPRVQSIRTGESTTGGIIYFAENSEELLEDQLPTLDIAIQIIRGKPQKIKICGHTSSKPLPTDSAYASHMDLGYARARQTMEYLVSQGIDPHRIRLNSAGDNEPIHIGYDKHLQEKNARVEILLLEELTEDLEGTKEEKQQRYSTNGDFLDPSPSIRLKKQ